MIIDKIQSAKHRFEQKTGKPGKFVILGDDAYYTLSWELQDKVKGKIEPRYPVTVEGLRIVRVTFPTLEIGY